MKKKSGAYNVCLMLTSCSEHNERGVTQNLERGNGKRDFRILLGFWEWNGK